MTNTESNTKKNNQRPTGARPSTRRARRYGFACTACKTRKVKCSGEQPVCAGCRRAGEDCIWPSTARSSDAQLLRDANERIRYLESSLEHQSTPPAQDTGHRASPGPAVLLQTEGQPLQVSQSSVSNGETPRSISTPVSHTTRARLRRSTHASGNRAASHSTVGPSPGAVSNSAIRHPESSSSAPAASEAADGNQSSLWYQLGIGEDGAVVYNGPTSRFHAGTLIEDDVEDEDDEDENDESGKSHTSVDEDENPSPFSVGTNDDARRGSTVIPHEPAPGHIATLRSQYDLMDSVWMPLIASKPKMNDTGVDTKTGVALLDIYWAWLHPLHHVVYRPAFMMDLALGGSHCSDFLLLCIFALAARHLPSESDDGTRMGEQYVERAKILLLEEMAAPSPKIPTIQGLIILGGRQSATGRSSQGWLYTGMAIRMMQDIGLHLDTTRLAGLMERWTPAETETRKRLYNSAYVWDKTLSLALGRPPTLIRKPYPSHQILDKFDDQRLWHPVHAKEVARSFEPCPSYVTTTLCVFASLHEITTDMMVLFTRSSGAGRFSEQLLDLDARFCRWYQELPSGVKIDNPLQLEHSPPPHIVSLNLIYHALHILLRRPFLGAANRALRREHINHCITHSKKIHAIHTLYTQTFPHRLMTYQVSYCIYTAATVEAQEITSSILSVEGRQEAAARLTAAVRILQNEASHTPGSGKSLDTIRRLLSVSQRPRIRTQGQGGRKRKRPQDAQAATDESTVVHTHEISAHVAGTGSNGGVGLLDEAAGINHTGDNHHAQLISPSSGYPRQSDYLGDPTSTSSMPTTSGHINQSVNFPQQGDLPVVVPVDSLAWEDDLGFNGGTDTGAGFHPDAFSWGVMTDDFPRMPSAQAPPTSASATAPGTFIYPTWSAQGGWFTTST